MPEEGADLRWGGGLNTVRSSSPPPPPPPFCLLQEVLKLASLILSLTNTSSVLLSYTSIFILALSEVIGMRSDIKLKDERYKKENEIESNATLLHLNL